MGEKLTQADIDKIQEEIDHRKLVLRPELIAAVKEARAQGDLSENFEYYAAKREKNQNESRIGYLERMLKFAELIEDDSAKDEVGLNDLVELRMPGAKAPVVYKIVTPIRGNSLQGRIAIDSPLGKALLGHKAGDKVQVKVSDEVSYQTEILSITPDDTDDDIRSF